MKVITQLVRHFWQRGALARQEVEYLLRHDFVRPEDLPGYKARKGILGEAVGEAVDAPLETPDELELIEEDLVRRQPARRGGHPENRSAELRVADLCARLRAEFQRREVDLASVLALGQRFSPVDQWWEAAAALRGVASQPFHRGLCAALREGDVLLGDIWQASNPEPFHLLIEDDEARGRAARSYLALLVASGPDALGKYSWVLKHDEMQCVINLRVLHQRLLESLCRIQRRDRGLLTRALAKNADPIQLWALVVLYNAYRNPRWGETPQYGVEYGPLPKPSYDVWRHAWTAALRMDRGKVTKLLVALYNQNGDEIAGPDSSIGAGYFRGRSLMCPVGWRLP